MCLEKITAENLLQIIAEEGVRSAYEKEKAYQAKMSGGKLMDEADDEEEDPLFGGGDEKEDGEEAPAGGGEEEGGETVDDADLGDMDLGGEEGDGDIESQGEPGDAGVPGEAGKDPAQTDKVGYVQSPLELELGKISYEGIGATLNMIRAGRSFKDADVAEQLENWVTSLSEPEQLALGVFLEALKDISEGSDSSQSPDPSDPSIGVNITTDQDSRIRPGGVQMSGDPNSPQQPHPHQGADSAPAPPPPGQPRGTGGEVNLQQQGQQKYTDQPGVQQVQQMTGGPPQDQVPQTTNAPESDEEDLEDTDAPLVVGRRNEAKEREIRAKIREMINREV